MRRATPVPAMVLAPVLALVLIGAATATGQGVTLHSTRLFDGERWRTGTVEVGEVAGLTGTVDLGDAPLTPGLVDLASRLGLAADPADTRAADGLVLAASDLRGDGKALLEAARREGITTVLAAPGDGAVLGGGVVALVPDPDGGPPAVLGDGPVAVKASLAVRSTTRGPTSAVGAAARLRASLAGTWRGMLLPAWVACRDDRQIRLAMGLEAEPGFDLVVLGNPRSDETITRLFAADVPVVLGPLTLDDGRERLSTPARLAGARARFAFSSGDRGAGALRLSAALAVRHGLAEIDALRALTFDAGKISGTESAGFVAWSGSPLDLTSRPILVVVGGEVLLDEREGATIAPARSATRGVLVDLDDPTAGLEDGDDRPLLLRAGRVLPIAGAPIVNGGVHVMRGKIAALAPGLEAPAGAEVIDLGDDAVLMPGLVDAASPLAGAANEQTEEVTPGFRVLAEIDVDGPGFAAALREGITAVYVPPGTLNVVGGHGAVLRTTGYVRVLRRSAEISVTFGRDAFAGNRGDLRRYVPAGIFYRRPGSRMGVNVALRRFFASDEAKTGGRLRALARTQRDLRTALRLAEEAGLRLVLEDATAAAEVAPLIAASGFPVVLGAPPHMAGSTRAAEGAEMRLAVAAALERAGVPIAFGSRTAAGRVGLRESAMLAHRYGLSRKTALRALTLEAASLSGVADRVGSLEPGKDADLVAFSGDPLDPASRVLMVIVEGRIVFDGRGQGGGR